MTLLLFQKNGDRNIIDSGSLDNPGIIIKRTDSVGETIEMMIACDVLVLFMDVDDNLFNLKQAIHTVELIRSSERHKQIPVVYLLQSIPESDIEFYRPGDGPVDYIIKPLNHSVIKNKIKCYKDLMYYRSNDKRISSTQNVYRRFFENGPSAFVMIDQHGYILDLNSSFLHNIAKPGHDKLDYIGQHIFSQTDLFHSKIFDMFKNIMAGKKTPKTDIVVTASPHASDKYYSVNSSPIIRGNHIEFVIFIFEDISERIEAENDLSLSRNELVRANSELQRMTEDLEKAISKANKMAVEAEIATISKSGFLASMSHEIRTPLNAVVGFTDLMLSTKLSEEQKEYIESIRDSSQTFLGLINDILDFSKIEADRVELEKIPFKLDSIMDEVVNTTGLRAYEKNIEIACQIQPGIPTFLDGDPVRLKQILVNIIGNAVKFTSMGHIFIRVFLVSLRDHMATVRFSISDTGIGIPSNKIEKIFQPFSQASTSTTREFGGTGLGLAISKKLAELMKGSISVQSPNPESHLNPGTVFHIETKFSFDPKKSTEKDAPEQNIHGKHVAIMSGDWTLLEFYSKMLIDAGMTVTPVNNPSEIFKILSQDETTDHEHSLLLIDDTIPLSSLKKAIDYISDGSLEKVNAALMLSPYSAMEKEILDIYPHVFSFITLLKKPFKLSHISKLLARQDHEADRTCLPDENGNVDAACIGYNILLVEDNKINQKVAIKMLKKMGHTVTVADNGNEALDILKNNISFDLVLMDGQMPVMDGFKATEIIRRNEQSKPDATRLPIIALTANAMKGDRDRYLNAGMDDYIAKPVKFNDLSTMITDIMRRKISGNLVRHNTMISQDSPEF